MTKTLVLDFIPKAKERPRVGRFGVYTPKATVASEKEIAVRWMEKYGRSAATGGVSVAVALIVPTPKSWRVNERAEKMGKPCLSRPDLDNVAKTVLDALNGVAYTDDALVYRLEAQKVYGSKAETIITITEEKTR